VDSKNYPSVILRKLAAVLQLESMWLEGLCLQLLQGRHTQRVHYGVLGHIAAPRLKQLRISHCLLLDGVAGLAEGLEQLVGLDQQQEITQLTYLSMRDTLVIKESSPAVSALAASSKLHHLDISNSTLREGAWRDIFPAGRHMPHLTYLDISVINPATVHVHDPTEAPVGSPGTRAWSVAAQGCATWT
jgi:hypothetical protein